MKFHKNLPIGYRISSGWGEDTDTHTQILQFHKFISLINREGIL
jgi:hypothetical protein